MIVKMLDDEVDDPADSLKQTTNMKSIIALALAALAASSPVAQNQEETRAVDPLIAGYWSCSIPTNAVYTKVQSVFNVCGSGAKPQYWVVYPSDNLISCRPPPQGSSNIPLLSSPRRPKTGLTPSDFVFTQVRLVFNTCNLGNNANIYTLRAPVAGLESCSQPPPQSGLAVLSVRPVWGQCNTLNTGAPLYKLVTPVANNEYCFYPGDWTYNSVRTTRSCNIINTDAPLYKVVKLATGVTSCAVPPGWTFSKAVSVRTCSIQGTQTSLYTLKKL
ncbi:hypothetical protein CPLU01_08157 [Colletotrichum plurivorum]|uniref:Uncharacterized protein n=1 Tax=Colletotrichum plurivorum TaxID=2175906 RepID=A0A8H6NDM6_9PEZI|nr:hypothetical protein CPLU01_08157 [Colletotrichum plurivorum]